MRPIEDRGLAIATHHRTYKAAMLGDRVDLVPDATQHTSIDRKCLIRRVGRAVKKLRSLMKRSPARPMCNAAPPARYDASERGGASTVCTAPWNAVSGMTRDSPLLGRRQQHLLESRGRWPGVAPLVLAEAVGQPDHFLDADNNVRPRPPKTGEVVGTEQLTGLAHAHCRSRALGTERSSAAQSAESAGLRDGHRPSHVLS